MIKQLIDMPFLKLQEIEYSDSIIRIYASVKSCSSRCPTCGKYSKRVHDYYYRTITDLPVFQNRTVILLKTRKFKCGNYQCNRKVFSEHTPDIVRYSRRTRRATRIAYCQQLPDINQPRVLGVDDWAYRKGVSYGMVQS